MSITRKQLTTDNGRRTNSTPLILHPLTLFRAILLSRRKKSLPRAYQLIGRTGSIEQDLKPEGFVLIDGELWPACLRNGACAARDEVEVRVVGARDHLLEVEMLSCKPS